MNSSLVNKTIIIFAVIGIILFLVIFYSLSITSQKLTLKSKAEEDLQTYPTPNLCSFPTNKCSKDSSCNDENYKIDADKIGCVPPEVCCVPLSGQDFEELYDIYDVKPDILLYYWKSELPYNLELSKYVSPTADLISVSCRYFSDYSKGIIDGI